MTDLIEISCEEGEETASSEVTRATGLKSFDRSAKSTALEGLARPIVPICLVPGK